MRLRSSSSDDLCLVVESGCLQVFKSLECNLVKLQFEFELNQNTRFKFKDQTSADSVDFMNLLTSHLKMFTAA